MATTPAKAPAAKPPTPKQTFAAKLAEGIRIQVIEWTVNIIILLFAWTSLVQAFVVPTGSMESTILIGDHLFVDKMAYAPPGWAKAFLPYTPVKRGDVICFEYPLDIRNVYVKRVVGVPGDRMKIVNRQVFINGQPLDEPYKQHTKDFNYPYFDNFPDAPPPMIYNEGKEAVEKNVRDGELVIPDGMIFAMGDNRDNSADSRWWGFVPKDNIIGKPVLIWWSYGADTDQLSSPLPTLDHLGDLAQNFFKKTRWERTFRLIRGHDSLPSEKR